MKIYGCFQKQWKHPKMDGENNGKNPLFLMDDLGGKKPHYFRKHPFLYHFKELLFNNIPWKNFPHLRSPISMKMAPTSSMTLNLKGDRSDNARCVHAPMCEGPKRMDGTFIQWSFLVVCSQFMWFFAYHQKKGTRNNHWFIDLLFCEV